MGVAVRRTAETFALALLLLATGCAKVSSSAAGEPPRLRLYGGSAVADRAVAPAGVGFGEWILVGPLPDKPTRAPVRRWPAGPAADTDVARLARALGMTAAPARHKYGWVVVGPAGELRVRDDGGHPWSYTRADRADCPPQLVDVDQAGDPNSGATCAGVAVSPPDPVNSPGAAGAPAPATTPGPPAPVLTAGPDAPGARAVAASLLAALGLAPADIATATVSVGTPDSTLAVAPTVDGLPTQGLETTVTVDRAGIAAAGGRLDLPTTGAVYPLRPAQQAFDEIADGPRPDIAVYCGPAPGASTPAPCASPQPIRVTAARIGLMLTYEAPSGQPTAIVVPAWFFQIDGGGESAQIAIDPAYLAPVTPQPVGTAGGAPGAGSDGSSGSGGTGTNPVGTAPAPPPK